MKAFCEEKVAILPKNLRKIHVPIDRYLDYMQDAFIIEKAIRYDIKPWRDENGILTIGLIDFLMDENCLSHL